MQLSNYISPAALRPVDLSFFLFEPYVECAKNIPKVICPPISPSSSPLRKRIQHGLVVFLLLIPVINVIALLVMRKLLLKAQSEPMRLVGITEAEAKELAGGPLEEARLPEEPKRIGPPPLTSESLRRFRDGIRKSLEETEIPIGMELLSECTHCAFTNSMRGELEDRVLRSVERIPRDKVVHIVSVGSGLLRSEWVIAARMVDKGFRHFRFHFIDTGYVAASEATPQSATATFCKGWEKAIGVFQKSLEMMGKIEVEIATSPTVRAFKESHGKEEIDVLLAIDVEFGIIREAQSLERQLLGSDLEQSKRIVDQHQKTYTLKPSDAMDRELQETTERPYVSSHYAYTNQNLDSNEPQKIIQSKNQAILAFDHLSKELFRNFG